MLSRACSFAGRGIRDVSHPQGRDGVRGMPKSRDDFAQLIPLLSAGGARREMLRDCTPFIDGKLSSLKGIEQSSRLIAVHGSRSLPRRIAFNWFKARFIRDLTVPLGQPVILSISA